GAVVLLVAWIPWLAVNRAPPEGRWLRFAAIHAVGVLAYSALHVAGSGPLQGTVTAARATPDQVRLEVDVDTIGPLDAVAPLGAHAPGPGERVALEVDVTRLAAVVLG
ncbi:MAG: hypothetical protein Q8Q44_04955, partial [Nocardioides sp.]|nr:hypothetical protein [Nocardioides sp.]